MCVSAHAGSDAALDPRVEADSLARSTPAIGAYMKAYRREGLAALDLGHSPGDPRRLTREQEAQVVAVLTDKVPQKVGYSAERNSTSPLVQQYIQDTFAVRFSEGGTRRLLYRPRFSCTRPTYTLAKADPARQAEFRVAFDEQKNS